MEQPGPSNIMMNNDTSVEVGGSEIHILSHFPADEQEMFKVDIQKFK